MQKIFILLVVLSVSAVSCKTSKVVSRSAYEPVTELNDNKEEATVTESDRPIMVKSEEVTIEKSTDNKLYRFYVIIGSFSNPDNAEKLQQQQIDRGEQPVILRSETGYRRVAVLGTDDELVARKRINEIRRENIGFDDIWLLKTK